MKKLDSEGTVFLHVVASLKCDCRHGLGLFSIITMHNACTTSYPLPDDCAKLTRTVYAHNHLPVVLYVFLLLGFRMLI